MGLCCAHQKIDPMQEITSISSSKQYIKTNSDDNFKELDEFEQSLLKELNKKLLLINNNLLKQSSYIDFLEKNMDITNKILKIDSEKLINQILCSKEDLQELKTIANQIIEKKKQQEEISELSSKAKEFELEDDNKSQENNEQSANTGYDLAQIQQEENVTIETEKQIQQKSKNGSSTAICTIIQSEKEEKNSKKIVKTKKQIVFAIEDINQEIKSDSSKSILKKGKEVYLQKVCDENTENTQDSKQIRKVSFSNNQEQKSYKKFKN